MTYFTDPGAVLNSLSHSNTSKRELHYLMGNLSDILSALHADHHGGDARCTLHVLTKSRRSSFLDVSLWNTHSVFLPLCCSVHNLISLNHLLERLRNSQYFVFKSFPKSDIPTSKEEEQGSSGWVQASTARGIGSIPSLGT